MTSKWGAAAVQADSWHCKRGKTLLEEKKLHGLNRINYQQQRKNTIKHPEPTIFTVILQIHQTFRVNKNKNLSITSDLAIIYHRKSPV